MKDFNMLPFSIDYEFPVANNILSVAIDPLRIRIMNAIDSSLNKEINVSEMENILDVRQPKISHHLALMISAKMVSRRKASGGYIYYRLTSLGQIVFDFICNIER